MNKSYAPLLMPLLFLTILSLNCNEYYMHVQQFSDAYVIPKHSNSFIRKDEKFYIATPSQIKQAIALAASSPRTYFGTVYLGSDSLYHFLQVWFKFHDHDDEADFFAVRLNDCSVTPIRSIDAECNYMPEHFTFHPWRDVTVDSICRVEADWTVAKWRSR